ncbi:MAG: putative flavin-dependent thymidylate synthase [Prokaryotic dsDNA virus sp.]|nr:MAG: putative flavin-dependent thymidylate synthase [Prokaryotic dsDNA virus sp.]|tara:strand:- start:11909 stop:12652 length:744 start_codon:yes stop_codon:yes gene_type:complete
MKKTYNKSLELYDDGIGKVEYVAHMGDDRTVVNSARVSFGKEVKRISARDKKLINYLIRHNHTSVFEHCSITFRIKVPLYIRSQHHRHRTWSYNEISRRYTEYNLEFYEPGKFRTQSDENRQASLDHYVDPFLPIAKGVTNIHIKASILLGHHHSNALDLYNRMIRGGICREQARGVLPQNLYTEYYATCNLSNLYKFIVLRTHQGAQWEIQKLAEAMLEIATDLYPITTAAFIKHLKDKAPEMSIN